MFQRKVEFFTILSNRILHRSHIEDMGSNISKLKIKSKSQFKLDIPEKSSVFNDSIKIEFWTVVISNTSTFLGSTPKEFYTEVIDSGSFLNFRISKSQNKPDDSEKSSGFNDPF